MPTIYDRTEFVPGEVGIIPALPYEVYRAAPGVAGSDLETLLRSPAEYHRKARGAETEEMQFGTLFHSLLLSGRADYHIRPETYRGPATTKAGAEIIDKEWNANSNTCKVWLADHADKPVLRQFGSHSASMLQSMVAKVKAHPLAVDLISRLTPEVSVFARHPDDGLLMKGRLDGLIRGETTIICELKTARDASTDAFSREILKRRYHVKAALYRMLLHQMKVSPVEYWFIIVETGGQARVNVRRLAERAMDTAEYALDDALTLLRKCRHANHWPEFIDGPFPGETFESPVIDLPDFAYGSVEELQGLTEITEEEEEKAS